MPSGRKPIQALLSLIKDAAQPDTLLQAHLTGAISLAESKNAARLLAREVQTRNAAGLHAELWTPEQVTELTAGRLNVTSVWVHSGFPMRVVSNPSPCLHTWQDRLAVRVCSSQEIPTQPIIRK